MATSAELLGAPAAAMDASVAYAEDREQFGRPIGSFQAVKHRCADMLVDVEGMRSSVYYAAWCLAAGDPDRSLAASTAKTWCADASKRVMASALQVHGGIGFTWECDVHLYLKRAQLDQLSFGDAVVHRQRLASRLRARVESGTSVIERRSPTCPGTPRAAAWPSRRCGERTGRGMIGGGRVGPGGRQVGCRRRSLSSRAVLVEFNRCRVPVVLHRQSAASRRRWPKPGRSRSWRSFQLDLSALPSGTSRRSSTSQVRRA
jgi:hypothetical protein